MCGLMVYIMVDSLDQWMYLVEKWQNQTSAVHSTDVVCYVHKTPTQWFLCCIL